MAMRRIALTVTLALFTLAAISHANVLVVNPGSGYTSIQDAVDAAIDGDVILIKPNAQPYDGFTIHNKGLYVTGDGGAGATVSIKESVTVRYLAAGKVVVLANLTMDPDSVPDYFSPEQDPALQLLNNQGAVRVVDCTLSGVDGEWAGGDAVDASAALLAETCSDLAVSRSFIRGGHGRYSPDIAHGSSGGAKAVDAYSSLIVLYDCALEGGKGGGNYGAAWYGRNGGEAFEESEDGFLFASGCTFTGGDGSYGTNVGGDGGHGIDLGTLAEAKLLDCDCQGGQGGDNGGVDGNPHHGVDFTFHPGEAGHFTMPSLAREDELAQLVFQGAQGDTAMLGLSALPGTVYKPLLKGQLLLAPPFEVISMGPVDSAGTLVFDWHIPDLGTGFGSMVLQMQSAFKQPSSKAVLATPHTLIVVEEIY